MFIGVVLLAATVYDLFFIQCMVSLKPVLASEDEGNQANGVPNGHYGVLEGDQDRTKAAAEGHQGMEFCSLKFATGDPFYEHGLTLIPV